MTNAKCWKKRTQESKSKCHKNARLKSSLPQVTKWLADRDINVDGMKRKAVFAAFLKELGVYHYGIAVNDQINKIYTDAENDLLGPQEVTFYSSPEWICLRNQVLMQYGEKCMRCGSESNIAVDHIKPRSLFADLELVFDNMQVLCRSCNSSKSNRHIVDYRC